MRKEFVTRQEFETYQRTVKRYRPVQLWRIASLGNLPMPTVKTIAANIAWLNEKYGKIEDKSD
jgi:hypothetical protein